MGRILLNGEEISKREAREKIGADPLQGLLEQSSLDDAVQTLLLEDNKKLGDNSVLIVLYDDRLMNRLEKLVLKLAQYVFNRKASNNK